MGSQLPSWPISLLLLPCRPSICQGHPEFDREVVEQLAAPRLAAIGEADAQRMRQVGAIVGVVDG